MTGAGLILASKSVARRRVLEDAGLEFEWVDANVDEDRLKTRAAGAGLTPAGLALTLAEAKALSVACGRHSMDLVIGCDQILALGDTLFDKPATMDDARRHLLAFSGKTHQLISAICLAQADRIVWSHVAHADMHVRSLSAGFIDQYLDANGERILSSVGAYLLEETGAQLFSRIDGDYFTVLGLPLLPLLEQLRKRGILPS